MNELIAERHFSLRQADGNITTVRVGLGKPYFDGHLWGCEIRIEGTDDDKSYSLKDSDSLEALIMSLWALERRIDLLKQRYGDAIWWGELEEGEGAILRMPDYCLYREPPPPQADDTSTTDSHE